MKRELIKIATEDALAALAERDIIKIEWNHGFLSGLQAAALATGDEESDKIGKIKKGLLALQIESMH